MVCRKNNFINAFVLFFYLFYAVLPLLYTTESEIAEGQADYFYALSPGAASTLNQNPLLVSADDQDEQDSPASGADFLLRKKRAIAPSFKETVAKLFPQYVKFSDCEPSFRTSFVPLEITDDTLDCPGGFSYYHSGISPPSA